MAGAIGLILRRIAGAKPGPTPLEVRQSRPMQSPQASTELREDGTVVIRAPLELSARGPLRWAAKRAKEVPVKNYELEPVGTFVWQLCDGKHTFESISSRLQNHFKMNRLEAEASLAAFLQMLGRRRLITLAHPSKRSK
jgi:hypothetical protein